MVSAIFVVTIRVPFSQRLLPVMSLAFFGVAKTNVNWSALPIADRAYERSHNWWRTRHVSLGYAKDDPVMKGVKT